MMSDTIDLYQAEQAVVALPHTHNPNYQCKTLHSYNRTRLIYLPMLPNRIDHFHEDLLLANVPVTCLPSYELIRRHHAPVTADALMMMNTYDYFSNFSLSQDDVELLASRLHVQKSIITFNADRFRRYFIYFFELYLRFREDVLHKSDSGIPDRTLNSAQMMIGLEFYLQIDVDLFYMKTCSFRGAQPRSIDEGLFCGKDEPSARYFMTPCHEASCSACTSTCGAIDFASSSMHRFANGYTTILNCPATCKTSNIIYAMTCPCGFYDYIDSTDRTLADAKRDHQEHSNRIIHEKLTGTRLYRGSILDPIQQENDNINKMRLYQHSARCSVALKVFLDCNPKYWCFIPMPSAQAITDNAVFFREASDEDPEMAYLMAATPVNHHRVAFCLERISPPPAGYTFSYRQQQRQRLFIEQFIAASVHEMPFMNVDVYQMKIIAVLPTECKTFLRYILETLFVIHGETKLNMICPIGGDPELRYGYVYDLVWCRGFSHPT